MSVVKPGQQWVWTFTVGDDTWFTTRVSEQARQVFGAGTVMAISRGDTFVVVTVDDAGPAEVPMAVPMLEPLGEGFDAYAATGPKRWHVILLRGSLCWFEDSWFDCGELLQDA